MSRRLLLPLLLASAVVARLPAETPATWNHWPYAAPIETGPVDVARLVSLVVPPSVAAQPGGTTGLRVIDAEGREVPYVLRVRRAMTAADWTPARLLEPSVGPGGDTEFIVDAGADVRTHNAARLALAADGDFLTWVEVAVSDDARTWRVVRERAPVYDLTTEHMGRSNEVSYPDSPSRYLRMRLLDAARHYTITGADLAFERTTTAELLPAPGTLAQVSDARPGRTTWVSTGDLAGASVAEVRFDSTLDAFDRPVSVETSEDGREWELVASGEIYRMHEHGEVRTSLSVRVSEATSPHWRVTLFNHNDAPLAATSPALYVAPRRVVFRQEPRQSYRLIYGNGRATSAEYDLERLVDADAVDAAAPVALGAELVNAAYEDPAPWTERHPIVLWAALGLAAAVLALVAVRSLKGTLH